MAKPEKPDLNAAYLQVFSEGTVQTKDGTAIPARSAYNVILSLQTFASNGQTEILKNLQVCAYHNLPMDASTMTALDSGIVDFVAERGLLTPAARKVIQDTVFYDEGVRVNISHYIDEFRKKAPEGFTVGYSSKDKRFLPALIRQ